MTPVTGTLPPLAPRIDQLVGSVYSNLVTRLGRYDGETYPFHVGDTWLVPPEGCRTEDVTQASHPGLNTYTPVPGWPPLITAVAARVAARTGVPVADDEVAITAGATAGLATVLGALVGPGSEVIILSPAWPLIAGMTTAMGGTPVHVPWFGEVTDAAQVGPLLDAAHSPRTVAVYVNTPNNPTGGVIPRAHLEAIVAWARRVGVWIVSDEVYEDLQFEGTHTYVRSLAPERTISAWSFSKGYGMSGNRCGYVVGPRDVIAGCRKMSTYTFYCAPRVAQAVALEVLSPRGDAWVAAARATYAALGASIADRLGVPRPQAGTFLFLDLRPFVGDEPVVEVLDRCVARGVLLAPGSVFGPYPHHVRLCFTAVEPERTRRGIEVLAGLLGR
ncbi:MAG: pyridoxal phosphate-dependent aminotransferase [Alphaproteobacteria bacterium]|nr:pyridoxal phosphate-dependent aminotransferase [Alphaproteobacteria bacterium]